MFLLRRCFISSSRRYSTSTNIDDALKKAANKIREADTILITAGAGIGIDSGLPDFRGSEGFWKAYPPLKKLNVSFQDMANPLWFFNDPTLAWGFYGHRLQLYRKTQPHYGFKVLKKILDSKTIPGFVFTSNVDGQFQKAGFDESRLVECHGSIHHIQCVSPHTCQNHSILSCDEKEVNPVVDEATMKVTSASIPLCPCGGYGMENISRPNILMFGDGDWVPTRTEEQEERFDKWLKQIEPGKVKVTVIDVGSGTAVATARHMGESVAVRKKGALIRINPREPQIYLSTIDGIQIPLGAMDALKKLETLLQL